MQMRPVSYLFCEVIFRTAVHDVESLQKLQVVDALRPSEVNGLSNLWTTRHTPHPLITKRIEQKLQWASLRGLMVRLTL